MSYSTPPEDALTTSASPAHSQSGEGPPSNEVSATPTGPPTAPQNLQATSGNAQVALTWQAPTSNGGSAITGYKVYRGTTAGSESLLTSLGNVLTYADSGLTNGQTYYYEVSAVNGAGEGNRVTVRVTVTVQTGGLSSLGQDPTLLAGILVALAIVVAGTVAVVRSRRRRVMPPRSLPPPSPPR